MKTDNGKKNETACMYICPNDLMVREPNDPGGDMTFLKMFSGTGRDGGSIYPSKWKPKQKKKITKSKRNRRNKLARASRKRNRRK